ncbi:Ras association (RalGDS/AF-6) domain family protein [Penicillium canescens]|uniref:Ras association (RalGDS/AF-6) domain family protein n=1 Tax=Penicillium canescens TaxID=5083 RepID=A0AAD6INQ1_PENCN|nr:Ras association (RalGDS/AF-6) domain family protein [Penicillium canescens]KAJ6033369.1 Ras association (RalGDS/AF-6) domain family protein [Penicillium canescens]KAJ6057441.1 Ras association (RalGDS/AF-6) domain family protein [Penicillium canescens]KAJ6058758.1 Ras association (RalGDS/AF-6) domain family protein [Penicillium canescens]KAJ6071625.1 Ras association (RalGDS/AF-6) domain family protein [Penicillium canescens]KAJ6170306.1 Ras association (RalGDS/AF-6) domain family protein [Pe
MYQLFGDLVLDPPPPDRLEAIKELEPYLRDLESREKLVVDRDEIHRKVSSFRLDETQKWKEMAQEGCPKRVAEHIVTTTGSWEARRSHQMHVPSYTSLNIPNGETGDPTSPCPALIMANKFDPETHFIYDHFHRREESDFSPFKGYPDHIRELHEEHTAWIRATNQAKVEIIYKRFGASTIVFGSISNGEAQRENSSLRYSSSHSTPNDSSIYPADLLKKPLHKTNFTPVPANSPGFLTSPTTTRQESGSR